MRSPGLAVTKRHHPNSRSPDGPASPFTSFHDKEAAATRTRSDQTRRPLCEGSPNQAHGRKKTGDQQHKSGKQLTTFLRYNQAASTISIEAQSTALKEQDAQRLALEVENDALFRALGDQLAASEQANADLQDQMLAAAVAAQQQLEKQDEVSRTRLAGLREQLAASEQANADLLKKIHAAAVAAQQKLEKHDELQSTIGELKANGAENEAALQRAKAELASLKESASGEASSTAESQGKAAELESQLGDVEGQLSESVAKCKAAVEEHSSGLAAVQAELEAVKEAHAAAASALESSLAEKEAAAEVSGKVSELASTIEELKATGAENEASLKSARAAVESLKESASGEASSAAEAQGKVVELESTLEELKATGAEKETTLANTRADLEIAGTQLAALRRQLAASEQLQGQMNDARQRRSVHNTSDLVAALKELREQLIISEEAKGELQEELSAAQHSLAVSAGAPAAADENPERIETLQRQLAASEETNAALQDKINQEAAQQAVAKQKGVSVTQLTALSERILAKQKEVFERQLAVLREQLVGAEEANRELQKRLSMTQQKLLTRLTAAKAPVAESAKSCVADFGSGKTVGRMDDVAQVVALKESIKGLQGQLAAADRTALSAQKRKMQLDVDKIDLQEQLVDSTDSLAALRDVLESSEEASMVCERRCRHLQNQVEANNTSGLGDAVETVRLRTELNEVHELVSIMTSRLQVSEEMLAAANLDSKTLGNQDINQAATNNMLTELKEEYDALKEKKRESDRKGGVMMGRLNDAHSTIALVSKQLVECKKREDVLKLTIEQLEAALDQDDFEIDEVDIEQF